MTNLRITRLGNSYVAVEDRSSGLRGLYHPNGTYRSGDLRGVDAELIGAAYKAS